MRNRKNENQKSTTGLLLTLTEFLLLSIQFTNPLYVQTILGKDIKAEVLEEFLTPLELMPLDIIAYECF